ncbi:hypothetical protein L596_013975 [Steinernema carpocapsae]|uniref:Uncharacterized protein n=1 Tax=Steinernema carpocapsae TaxID=34508 RepID=A0A4U5NA70_STECR|nr:hypothetical protein L596_013975 [Steinernema carpocapsae]
MLSIMIILNCVGVTVCLLLYSAPQRLVQVFLILYRLNKRLWKRDLKRNLTFRYQIMENVRTSKQLLIVLLVDFIM